MNQLFFVTLSRRGVVGDRVSWLGARGLGALDDRGGGSEEDVVVVRDLYHAAVDVEGWSWSGFSGGVVGEDVRSGTPHPS